jgi:transposase-like protein
MAISVKGAQVPTEVRLMGVRWYLAYPLSTRHVEARMAARGVAVDHATMQSGVITERPLLDEALPRRKQPVWRRGCLDETSITVQGVWHARSGAVD